MLPYLMPSGLVTGGRGQVQMGLDVRYQPTPELTSVATLNPDFASVEGAVESIGFSRSERFVPDARPFFLEGRNYLQLGDFYAIGSYFDSAARSSGSTRALKSTASPCPRRRWERWECSPWDTRTTL